MYPLGAQKGVGDTPNLNFWIFSLIYIYQKATKKSIAKIILGKIKMMIRPTVQCGCRQGILAISHRHRTVCRKTSPLEKKEDKRVKRWKVEKVTSLEDTTKMNGWKKTISQKDKSIEDDLTGRKSPIHSKNKK